MGDRKIQLNENELYERLALNNSEEFMIGCKQNEKDVEDYPSGYGMI